ncbi:MAG TPA: hypothetical protein VFK07_03200 [Candidatus Paceibacterota bacterium]|nr:hypothetical protein [Candidatus Paceibacterota bacterium]
MASAQTQQFHITSPTANVRLDATTKSQVIDQVHAGAILPVISAEGNWVKVQLPARDGIKRVGFIYLNLGSLELVASKPDTSAPAEDAVPAKLESKPAPAKEVKTEESNVKRTSAKKQPPVPLARVEKPEKESPAQLPVNLYGVPHTFGLGAQAGGFTFGLGANIRYWSRGRFGFQLGISHFGFGDTDNTTPGIAASSKVSSIQIAPSVIYRFGNPPEPDDTFVAEPYVGGGLNIFRSSISATASGFGQTLTQSESAMNMGGQGFVGAEVFFKSMPKLGLSGDLGYYSTSAPFAGYSIGGFAITVSAHWYPK